jgi:predicted nucleic acid-binding protein
LNPPTPILVVDAAILVAAARGRSSGALMEAANFAALITTDRAVEEAGRRIVVGMKRPELMDILEALTDVVEVARIAALAPLITRAEFALRHAVAGANGSIRDAHVLALAWAEGADIWTTDRDFAGTGVATWSTPNLMRALSPA